VNARVGDGERGDDPPADGKSASSSIRRCARRESFEGQERTTGKRRSARPDGPQGSDERPPPAETW
jgi:hypothetical protein